MKSLWERDINFFCLLYSVKSATWIDCKNPTKFEKIYSLWLHLCFLLFYIRHADNIVCSPTSYSGSILKNIETETLLHTTVGNLYDWIDGLSKHFTDAAIILRKGESKVQSTRTSIFSNKSFSFWNFMSFCIELSCMRSCGEFSKAKRAEVARNSAKTVWFCSLDLRIFSPRKIFEMLWCYWLYQCLPKKICSVKTAIFLAKIAKHLWHFATPCKNEKNCEFSTQRKISKNFWKKKTEFFSFKNVFFWKKTVLKKKQNRALKTCSR